MKKLLMVLLVVVWMMSCLTACANKKCSYRDCSNERIEGTDYEGDEFTYCVDHKCKTRNCGYPIWNDDCEYCTPTHCITEEETERLAQDIIDDIFG